MGAGSAEDSPLVIICDSRGLLTSSVPSRRLRWQERNRSWRAGGDLVDQGLEELEVASVDEREVDRLAGELARRL